MDEREAELTDAELAKMARILRHRLQWLTDEQERRASFAPCKCGGLVFRWIDRKRICASCGADCTLERLDKSR